MVQCTDQNKITNLNDNGYYDNWRYPFAIQNIKNYRKNGFRDSIHYYVALHYKPNAIIFIINFYFKLIGCFIVRNKEYNIMKS